MASNYLWTGGNILLSLGGEEGGGGGAKNIQIFFLGGGGGGEPKKMEIQFQIFTPLINNEHSLRHSVKP